MKNDFHDWDLAAAPALLTTKSGRSFIAAGSKDGYVYGIDRSGIQATAGDRPDPNVLAVRAKVLTTTRENADTPLRTDRMTRFCPGTQGGIEWNGPTYHPALGLVWSTSIPSTGAHPSS